MDCQRLRCIRGECGQGDDEKNCEQKREFRQCPPTINTIDGSVIHRAEGD